jgi:hypothetical protein
MAGPFAGQGEHIAVVLALPWLAGTAAAATGHRAGRTGAMTAGVAAGIGLAMKPHFALVWLVTELWLARRVGPRSLLRTESIAIVAVFCAYLAATALFAPTVFTLIPWVAPLYARFAPASLASMLTDPRLLLVAAGAAACFAVRRGEEHEPATRVLCVAALAMTAAVLLQGKGWGYHWYPAMALSVMLIGLTLHSRLGRLRMPATAALAVLAVAGASWQVDRTARLLVREPTMLPQLMEAVEQYGRDGPIVAFSYTLQTGFPLINLTGTEWASPYAHLWMVPALYHGAFTAGEPLRYRDTGKWAAVEQEIFDRLWDRIERDDPSITILQGTLGNGFDMRAYFETDARFRDRFARSPVLDTIGRYVLLGRPSGP